MTDRARRSAPHEVASLRGASATKQSSFSAHAKSNKQSRSDQTKNPSDRDGKPAAVSFPSSSSLPRTADPNIAGRSPAPARADAVAAPPAAAMPVAAAGVTTPMGAMTIPRTGPMTAVMVAMVHVHAVVDMRAVMDMSTVVTATVIRAMVAAAMMTATVMATAVMTSTMATAMMTAAMTAMTTTVAAVRHRAP